MVKSNGTIGPLQVSSDTDSRKDGQYTNRDFREEAETGFPAVNSTDPMNRAGRRCSPVLRTYPSIRLLSHNSRSESHIQGKIQTFIPSPGEISTLVKNGSRQVTGKAYHEMDIRSWGKPDRERERKPGIHEERNGGDGECTPELNNSTENTRNKGKQNEGTRNKGKQNEVGSGGCERETSYSRRNPPSIIETPLSVTLSYLFFRIYRRYNGEKL